MLSYEIEVASPISVVTPVLQAWWRKALALEKRIRELEAENAALREGMVHVPVVRMADLVGLKQLEERVNG